MHYWIDGYNLLFFLTKSYKAVREREREILIAIGNLNLDATVVFDGKQKEPNEVIRGHLKNLEIIYTSPSQSADDYILEQIDASPNPSQEVVVSSDRELIGKARQRGASIQTVQQFLTLIIRKKKRKPAEEKQMSDTDANIERLRKIFESSD